MNQSLPLQKSKKEDKKRWREEQRTIKKINKMTILNPYLSIISLNVSGLNSWIKSLRVAEWIFKKGKTNKTQLYATYKRLTAALRMPIGCKERMEKDTSCKWKPKKTRDNCAQNRQNRLQVKSFKKRQRHSHTMIKE